MKVFNFVITIASCIVPNLCGEHPDGESQVSRSQDALGNYHFSYKVANNEGEQFREEGTDTLGRVIGSYGLKHVDGTHRVVDYVADKDGFRASVRSNEHGLVNAEAADAPVFKVDQSVPLSVAATSDDASRLAFGRRIDLENSKVEYVTKESRDEVPKESRQRNFDDYRPLHPVAYYPTDTRSPLIPAPAEQPRSPRKISSPDTSEEDSKPADVYLPPLDPHKALRRPPYYISRDRTTDNYFPPTTSRKPYIPPYGGFDDDEDEPILPVERRPSVGLRPDQNIPPPLIPIHTARKFPPTDRRSVPPTESRNFSPLGHSNFDVPRLPPSALQPRPPISSFPPQDPPLFDPPSYDRGLGVSRVVLRAVPIPNGIQAVRVDPTSGRVIERLVYPLFLRHDGKPEYDRNILLHNDDITDDGNLRYDDPSYLDMPYLRGSFRGVRNQPTYGEDDGRFRNNFNNRSNKIDEKKLSEPSANEIAWIKKQLALVEGFDRNPFPNHFLPPRHEAGFFDDDFGDENREQYERRIPSSRNRPDSSSYSRDDLVPEGSKVASSELQKKDDNLNQGNDEKDSEVKEV